MTVHIISTLVGALGGYLYYRIIGCRSGMCPLTGSPVGSILYGGLLGFMIAGMINGR